MGFIVASGPSEERLHILNSRANVTTSRPNRASKQSLIFIPTYVDTQNSEEDKFEVDAVIEGHAS